MKHVIDYWEDNIAVGILILWCLGFIAYITAYTRRHRRHGPDV